MNTQRRIEIAAAKPFGTALRAALGIQLANLLLAPLRFALWLAFVGGLAVALLAFNKHGDELIRWITALL